MRWIVPMSKLYVRDNSLERLHQVFVGTFDRLPSGNPRRGMHNEYVTQSILLSHLSDYTTDAVSYIDHLLFTPGLYCYGATTHNPSLFTLHSSLHSSLLLPLIILPPRQVI